MTQKKFLVLTFVAFLGALCGHFLFPFLIALAEEKKGTPLKKLYLMNGTQSHSSLTKGPGGGFLSLGDFSDRKQRVFFTIYAGSGEKGLPLMGLYDKKAQLRLLFRLAPGSNSSPVIVFKNGNSQDAMVVALDLNKESEIPYLNYQTPFSSGDILKTK
jgi:hypothetical protein